MKKLAFISLAVLGFGGVTEMVLGMNPPDEGQCSQTKCNYEEVKQLESEKGKETLDEIADVSRNNPEMTAMTERIIKQAEDLQEQMKSLKEKINGLTMQETLSSEAERIKQLEENLPLEVRTMIEIQTEDPYPKKTITQKEIALRQVDAEAREKAGLKEQVSKVNLEIKKLERERDKWSAYIDGRRKLPERMAGPFFEKEKQEFEQRIKRAPDIIADIDSRISKLKAFLGQF